METLSPAEFSRKSGLSLNHVYALLWGGRIAASKEDGQWRIPATELSRRPAKIDEEQIADGYLALVDELCTVVAGEVQDAVKQRLLPRILAVIELAERDRRPEAELKQRVLDAFKQEGV